MDRAVLITGASRGIGAAVARRFAREGWRVGVNYRTSRGRAEALAAEIAAAGGQTALLPGDVSDPAQAAALVRAAEELGYPLFVKPVRAGSSFGVSKVNTPDQLPAAVEEARACRHVFFFEEGIQRGGIGEHFSFLLEEAGFEGRFHLRGIADPYIKHAPMFRSLETLGLNAESMETLVRATLAQEKGGPHEETA